MSEVGGITELQQLEFESKLLQQKWNDVEGAEATSGACSRLVQSIHTNQAKDGFLTTEGSGPNIFHTAAGAQGDQGCCLIS